MNDQPFTNRELKEFFTDIHEDVKEVKIRVGIQNGRVSKLEKWQSFTMGGLAIIGAVILPLMFMVVNSLLSQMEEDKTPTTTQGITEKAIELEAEAKKLEAQLK